MTDVLICLCSLVGLAGIVPVVFLIFILFVFVWFVCLFSVFFVFCCGLLLWSVGVLMSLLIALLCDLLGSLYLMLRSVCGCCEFCVVRRVARGFFEFVIYYLIVYCRVASSYNIYQTFYFDNYCIVDC